MKVVLTLLLWVSLGLGACTPTLAGNGADSNEPPPEPGIVQKTIHITETPPDGHWIWPAKWNLGNYRAGEVVVECPVRVHVPRTVTITKRVTTVEDDHVLYQQLGTPVKDGDLGNVVGLGSSDPRDCLYATAYDGETNTLTIEGFQESAVRYVDITYVPAYWVVQIRLEHPNDLYEGYTIVPHFTDWVLLNGKPVSSCEIQVGADDTADVVVTVAVPWDAEMPPAWEFRVVAGGGVLRTGGVAVLCEHHTRFLISEKAIGPDG